MNNKDYSDFLVKNYDTLTLSDPRVASDAETTPFWYHRTLAILFIYGLTVEHLAYLFQDVGNHL